MSKPAARIGDMHACPMVTPGLPPVPHVGGPIIGPGVPTVLIGGVPASVMGDMCTCVGPPDSIILGSSGVLIGGKPAARMGDVTSHGGSIVAGLPTVLIGEISPGTVVTKTSLTILEQMPPFAADTARQVLAMQEAAASGKPFCEECTTEKEEVKILHRCYFVDESENPINRIKIGKTVFFIIESTNMSGEEVEIDFSDSMEDFEYKGQKFEDDILKITLKSDRQKIKLKVVEYEPEESEEDE